MHIARHRRGCARYFHAQILTLAAAALIAVPALAAGPGGPVGPVVAPPKSPSTPAAPAVVAPTAPVIPQAPVVMPNIPSVTTGPGAPTGTAKTDSPADDANSGKKDGNGTSNAFTATVTPTTTGGGVPSGIADQANASTLTSYLRIPDTQLTPGMFRSNRPLLDVAIVVKKHSGGNSLQVKTDGKGNTSIGKLTPGESYDIQISGKDLEPALDRVGTSKTGTFLVALLLPAVQQAREADRSIPASSTQRAFTRGSKDQAIHLSLVIAKDGTATINWGDGHDPIPVGIVKSGAGILTLSASSAYVGPTTVASGDLTSASNATKTYTSSTTVNGGVLNSSLSTKGNPGSGRAPGIFDQANAGTLTSYLRIPNTQFTPQPNGSDDSIPGLDIVVKNHPGGNSLQVKTDSKGNTSIGKLMHGESYDIQISGKDIEPALDRIAGGKTNGGTAQPQKIIGVLVALLLPAVQKIGTIPSEPSSRAFARGSKDQAIHLTFAVAKDGMLTVDWGDGSGKQSIGQYTGNTTVNMGIRALYSGDAN